MVQRLSILIAGFTLGYVGLLFNLYNLQVAKGDHYLARAESQFSATSFVATKRGDIQFTDKNGNSLAAVTNKEFPQIYAVPKVIEDPSETSYRVAPLLGLSPQDLTKRLSRKDDAYELLGKKIADDVASEIQNMNIKGVYVEQVPERFYPFGKLASHVFGFVAPNNKDAGENGKYGVEEFYDKALTGKEGDLDSASTPGKNLNLTIDPNIQLEAERVLDDLIASSRSTSGTVIVEDPKTGKILAMGSYPNFDPNSYSQADIADFLNPATQQIFEPGSVFKVITMSSALDAGKVTPNTTFTDTGKLVLNNSTIRNWDLKAHGVVTMTNVIEQSLNTGSAFAERQLGDDLFKNYVQKYGFGEKTGIDLPGELKGDLRNLSPKAPPINYATASFGQGVAVTPIQMVNAIAAIANGGTLLRPYINSSLEPKTIRRVIGEEAARKVTEMMTSAVDKAKIAKISGYTIAGKTGTAQVPDPRTGGYTKKVIDSYIGFGPTKDPKFIIMIKINEPEGAPLAGTTVVPAFRNLAQFILNYYNVAPDRIEN